MYITVVIISYNEKEYLEQAVNSCISQKINDNCKLEIIIGNDGSNDGSIELIENLKKKYPNIINYFANSRNKEEKYVPSIRVSNVIKKALEISKGDYLQILSCDDILCDDENI